MHIWILFPSPTQIFESLSCLKKEKVLLFPVLYPRHINLLYYLSSQQMIPWSISLSRFCPFLSLIHRKLSTSLIYLFQSSFCPPLHRKGFYQVIVCSFPSIQQICKKYFQPVKYNSFELWLDKVLDMCIILCQFSWPNCLHFLFEFFKCSCHFSRSNQMNNYYFLSHFCSDFDSLEMYRKSLFTVVGMSVIALGYTWNSESLLKS